MSEPAKPHTVVDTVGQASYRRWNPSLRSKTVQDPNCLFCRIVAGEIPADIVHETERTISFRDIAPKAPVHVLVIPRDHVASLGAAGDDHGPLLGELMLAARDVAAKEGLSDSGFRTVLNTGADGGQEVMHVHAHVLGGRSLTWPPG